MNEKMTMPYGASSHLEEEEMKANPKAKVYARVFNSIGRDTIEYVIRFRIGNHTMKRGTLMQNSYLSATRCELTLQMHWI